VRRLIACVPGTTLGRWLREVLPPHVGVQVVTPEELVTTLEDCSNAGALILLGRSVASVWPTARQQLARARTGTILLVPLSAEALHAVAFERELRVLALHIVGVEDSPATMMRSLERLLYDSNLQQLLRSVSADCLELEALILPIWDAMAEVRTLEQCAGLLGTDAATLTQRLRMLGVRSPRRLVTWLRLLNAWPRLHAGEPASRVAMDVGYSAAPAFTRCARHFVGILPSAAASLSVDDLIQRAAADLVA
jgi:AraC-like DNA-binding protein